MWRSSWIDPFFSGSTPKVNQPTNTRTDKGENITSMAEQMMLILISFKFTKNRCKSFSFLLCSSRFNTSLLVFSLLVLTHVGVTFILPLSSSQFSVMSAHPWLIHDPETCLLITVFKESSAATFSVCDPVIQERLACLKPWRGFT